MSPSAVIFGPMIAIFSESLLLELFVRLLGRTYAGYITGAMLAMSWNLFQKIANYIIFYGPNIIEVYANLLKLAQKQLNIQSDIVWLPIFLLLAVYSVFGLFAAVIGIRVGRKLLAQPDKPHSGITGNNYIYQPKNSGKEFNYSIMWLCINILLIIGSFFLLNYSSWFIWGSTITAIIIIWSFRYKRAMRQLSKPGFWFFFVFITLVTALVFTKAETGKDALREGLMTGFQMNFRAVVIIVGFSVLGTELYNPRVRNFFLRTSFKNLPMALELSAESLPSVIAGIPDFKSLIRNPVSIFYEVISNANTRLGEIKNKINSNPRVYIISGKISAGKTTFTKKLAVELKRHNVRVGGIISEKVVSDSQVIGYDLIDIETNDSEIFLRRSDDVVKERIGRFGIFAGGIERGIAILTRVKQSDNSIVIIDEVGALELGDKGWSGCLEEILKSSNKQLLIIVRENLLEEVIHKWDLCEPVVFKVSETDYMTAAYIIINNVNA
jgi:nucleoside-triphosphatase THEP1